MSDSEGYQALAEAEVEAAETKRRNSWLQRWRLPMMIGGPAAILVIAGFFVLTAGRSQATEDAYVQVAKAPVAASVSGRVIEVLVKENQHVKRGDPLFRLDPRDFDAATELVVAQLAQARGQALASKAGYSQAVAGVAQAQAGLTQSQAKLAEAQAQVTKAQDAVAFTTREADRQHALFEAGVGSKEQAEQADHAAQNARSDLVAAQSNLNGAQSDLAAARADITAAQAAQAAALATAGGRPDQSVEQHPLVQAAQANLDRARLTGSYAVVTAPADGVVTRVDQLQPGAYVNASQTLFWLIAGQPWIEANFKEDQLEKMKIGQPVTIKIDALGSEKLSGHVESFSPGTGQVFSALPAQNATGNWVKVTQRLPVRIVFDQTPPEMAGRGGLSAHVKVDVTGPGRPASQTAAR